MAMENWNTQPSQKKASNLKQKEITHFFAPKKDTSAVAVQRTTPEEGKKEEKKEEEGNVEIVQDLFPLSPISQWPEIQFIMHRLENNSTVLWCQHFLTNKQSELLFKELLGTMTFEQSEVNGTYGKYKIPRLQAWMADDGIDNKKASLFQSQPSKKWSNRMLYVKERIEQKLGVKFNYVLINYYRDGRDHISWHSDREAIERKKNTIGSVSLGSPRKFLLRHLDHLNKPHLKPMEFTLTNGSLIVMKDDTQKYWQHSIPKMNSCKTGRINLTFRSC
ncbi:alkylated DNA repair protein [Reticulomyxa filosa]|uniref:Alkylated DNA repair protein n=1 Tax=Reticulomyxa filosa TaxID=46433 RepID=X6MNI5_RETFI|nr:alkylated DNA repair protein [Reticulomyxa filosa]|eukprot:ETO15384.1 alkylated DNA repair protein [Reticulomyxa filosa]